MGLLDKVELVPSTHARTAVDTTTILSPIVDMAGADGFLFIHDQSSGSSGTPLYRLLASSANSTAGMNHLRPPGTTAASTAGMLTCGTLGADNLDNSKVMIDVVRPVGTLNRYYMIAVDGASDITSMTMLKYNLTRMGSTQAKDSTSLGGTTSVVGPGTS